MVGPVAIVTYMSSPLDTGNPISQSEAYTARSSSVNHSGRGVDKSARSIISWSSFAIGISLLEKST